MISSAISLRSCVMIACRTARRSLASSTLAWVISCWKGSAVLAFGGTKNVSSLYGYDTSGIDGSICFAISFLPLTFFLGAVSFLALTLELRFGYPISFLPLTFQMSLQGLPRLPERSRRPKQGRVVFFEEPPFGAGVGDRQHFRLVVQQVAEDTLAQVGVQPREEDARVPDLVDDGTQHHDGARAQQSQRQIASELQDRQIRPFLVQRSLLDQPTAHQGQVERGEFFYPALLAATQDDIRAQAKLPR